MPGDIHTASGSKYYIGPVASSTVDTTGEFAALSYTEIGLVEDGGEFGDQSASVTGAALGDARIRKAKGARDAGTMTLVCFHDPQDTGQLAVEAAEQTSSSYAFKVVLNDGGTGAGTWSNGTYYFRALVNSRRKRIGTNDNIMRNTYNIDINSQIYAVPGVFTT